MRSNKGLERVASTKVKITRSNAKQRLRVRLQAGQMTEMYKTGALMQRRDIFKAGAALAAGASLPNFAIAQPVQNRVLKMVPQANLTSLDPIWTTANITRNFGHMVFDTLYAEGQRRYVESLSAYARQFLGKLDKPDVDKITGISPAIAIEQKVTSKSSRSTVGTTTEIYDYLKLLYARVGKTYSPVSGKEVKYHTPQDILEEIEKRKSDRS